MRSGPLGVFAVRLYLPSRKLGFASKSARTVQAVSRCRIIDGDTYEAIASDTMPKALGQGTRRCNSCLKTTCSINSAGS